MTALLENPMGLDGFAFCEFTSPDPEGMAAIFQKMGFVVAARCRERRLTLYRQGSINFVLNASPMSHAAEFCADHGPSVSAMAFRVANAKRCYEAALDRGAKLVEAKNSFFADDGYAIEGVGGSYLYLVDDDPFIEWEEEPHWREAAKLRSVGLNVLDHLTHSLRRGHMHVWSTFYSEIFGFREQNCFDVRGQVTGLISQAMIGPDNAVRIPLIESQDDNSQVEEFIRDHNGEGIQHLALTTDNICYTVQRLRERGIRFRDTVETYYNLINDRIPGHGEDVQLLQEHRILIDGAVSEGFLLQIFTEEIFGPVFFEIIQRKGNQGFGQGNIRALFESIELDQIRRGVVSVED